MPISVKSMKQKNSNPRIPSIVSWVISLTIIVLSFLMGIAIGELIHGTLDLFDINIRREIAFMIAGVAARDINKACQDAWVTFRDYNK